MQATTSPDIRSAGRLLRLSQVIEVVGISRSSWWAGVRAGRYPAAKKLGGATCWHSDDIDDLIRRVRAGDPTIALTEKHEQLRKARAVRTKNDLARKAASAPTPAPAPRKRGRPRKAVDAAGAGA